MKERIYRLADLLPAPLQKLVRGKAFLYLFTAGIATVVDIMVYFLFLNFVLHKQPLIIADKQIGAAGLSIMVSYNCGLVTNFVLTKLIVFQESELRTRYQFLRFFIVAVAVFFANYGFMKFLIDVLEVYPTLARGISAITIGVLSFLIHKVFTFGIKD